MRVILCRTVHIRHVSVPMYGITIAPYINQPIYRGNRRNTVQLITLNGKSA